MLDFKKLEATINLISIEKKIPKEKLIDIIESALKTAYKKDYGTKDSKVNVKINLEEKILEISLEKTVVKTVENSSTEISFDELGDDAKNFEEGDIIEIDVTDDIIAGDNGESFGRIASQAARQVIIQKIADSEKEKIYDLFVGKEGKVVNMKVEIVEGGKVIFDYNGNQVILPKSEQVSKDNYVADARFYILIAEVTNKELGNPKVILSRKRKELIPALFDIYVPEIGEGIVTIDKVVRYPGVKSKILVSTNYDQIDPVGTLIGQKGIRVKSVMEELSGEKIDIVANSDDIRDVIKRALIPANVLKVNINDEKMVADVYITNEEKPKIIGKSGININLASELVGYKINLMIVD
ncbi:MAG: transcription termination factor NusA [Candidatus Gracilibacteria bacterium]|nr:transcription termination factor NusA [Candidatus Gracilibacteria bacterium]